MAGKVIIISGAGSGFGAGAARRLADDGNTVYAGMRETTTRNAPGRSAADVPVGAPRGGAYHGTPCG
ncbi:hypothetical protein GCM10017559_66210 [Streptosporangium longisporum]|uniref:Uncharacterized protein n=1 Tax=Streptosporangium longisporum TaxID=46187 RepID=A0ABP6L1X8_9ACTN